MSLENQFVEGWEYQPLHTARNLEPHGHATASHSLRHEPLQEHDSIDVEKREKRRHGDKVSMVVVLLHNYRTTHQVVNVPLSGKSSTLFPTMTSNLPCGTTQACRSVSHELTSFRRRGKLTDVDSPGSIITF